jgi:hypothetical protein
MDEKRTAWVSGLEYAAVQVGAHEVYLLTGDSDTDLLFVHLWIK